MGPAIEAEHERLRRVLVEFESLFGQGVGWAVRQRAERLAGRPIARRKAYKALNAMRCELEEVMALVGIG